MTEKKQTVRHKDRDAQSEKKRGSQNGTMALKHKERQITGFLECVIKFRFPCRFSQILKKSGSSTNGENRSFCGENSRVASLDEDLTPEAQEAYNMLVGSLGRDKKRDGKKQR